MEFIKLIVIEEHRSEYPEPITFEKGVHLCIGERYSGNEGWDDWYLCSIPGQRDGWVPKQIIERTGSTSGKAKEGYTAKELDVDTGEMLRGSTKLNGWIWCGRLSGTEEGWVPLKNVREIGVIIIES